MNKLPIRKRYLEKSENKDLKIVLIVMLAKFQNKTQNLKNKLLF